MDLQPRLSPLTGSAVTTTGLPSDVMKAGARRVGVLCVGLGVLALTTLVVRRVALSQGWEPAPELAGAGDLITVIICVVCLAIAAAARSARVSAENVLRLGMGLEVFLCFNIGLLERVLLHFGEGGPAGMSAALGVYLAFPAVVPLGKRQRYTVTFLALLALPLGSLIGSLVYAPIQDWAFWSFSFLPTMLLGSFGLLLWRIVHRLGLELRDARQLGSYRLSERLGAGGMGEVWRAHHTLLARPAAIKLIRADKMGNKAAMALARFEREAKATAQLRSPHSVELYDFGYTAEGSFYYVMELLDGIDLDQFVSRYGAMPPARVVHVLRQVCLSLSEAHRAGLIHRDIKPANLFLCRMGVELDFVKVLDFGLVLPTGFDSLGDIPAGGGPGIAELDDAAAQSPDSTPRLTVAGATVGTPAFMAPENALGQTLDARADLYAVGCVAYWLITGRHVFDGTTVAEMVHAHVSRMPNPLSAEGGPQVPTALDALITSCLAKDPDRRPATAQAMGDALARIAEQLPWSNEDARRWWEAHEPVTGSGEDQVDDTTSRTIDLRL